MDNVAERNLHRIFLISLAVKAFDGLGAVVAGTALLFVSPAYLNGLFLRLAKGELLESPQDIPVRYVQEALLRLSVSAQVFAGFYILIHGLLNLFLVFGIYKEKLWAYWVAMICIGMFVCYQLYLLSYSFSPGIIILTSFDLFFIFLTWHEYKLHEARIIKRSKSLT